MKGIGVALRLDHALAHGKLVRTGLHKPIANLLELRLAHIGNLHILPSAGKNGTIRFKDRCHLLDLAPENTRILRAEHVCDRKIKLHAPVIARNETGIMHIRGVRTKIHPLNLFGVVPHDEPA